MNTTLLVFQIVFSVVLIVLIIIQPKGSGLGRSWGGSSTFARRGLEKLIFKSTFVVAFLLIATAIVQLVL